MSSNSNVTTYRTRSGNTIVRTFDELGREATRTPQGQATISNTYDLAGRLIKIGTPVVFGDPSTGDLEFFFDTAGRLWKEKYPDGKTIERILDANGNQTKITWPDGYYVDRVFDELNRLTDIKLNGSGTSVVQFFYNSLSQRIGSSYSNGATCVYQVQSNGDVTGVTHNFIGSSIDFAYGFNNAHQLSTVSISDNSCVYHPTSGTTLYATADAVNEYPSVAGISLTYDGNGNLSGDGTWSYSFDTDNHLISASKTGVSATFVYDPLHRQSQKTVNSTKSRYIYSGWQRFADYDGTTDSLQNRYIYSSRLDEPLIVVSAAGVVSFLHSDRLGNVVATSDNSGAVIVKNAFGVFGETASIGTGNFGFTGQRYDSELGLYYFKNRYYSPTFGRFLQTDPIGYHGGLNLYSYVFNSPTDLTDPLGLDAFVPTSQETLVLYNNMIGQGTQIAHLPLTVRLALFHSYVKAGSMMDYKSLYPYPAPQRVVDFGNFNFGAVGAAADIPFWVLQAGAGVAQYQDGKAQAKLGRKTFDKSWILKTGGDDPKDFAIWKAGYDWAQGQMKPGNPIVNGGSSGSGSGGSGSGGSGSGGSGSGGSGSGGSESGSGGDGGGFGGGGGGFGGGSGGGTASGEGLLIVIPIIYPPGPPIWELI